MISSFSIIVSLLCVLFTLSFSRGRFGRNDNDCEQPTDSASPVSQFVVDPVEEPSHLEPEPSQPAVGEEQLSVPQVEITTICATDLTLGLRRIPAGFYVTVQADDAQWQTTNKAVHVDVDVLEWNDRIVLPSETSYKVRFSVYASFELGSMLGRGDLLRTFEISVADLLDHSKNSRPIVFQPKAGEVVSPCTSLLISVEQSLAFKTEVAVLCPITPSTSYDTSTLIVWTDAGHSVLERYQQTQINRDLDQSIAHFKTSHDLCPVDHPCRAAVLCNLATAKFISCQVNGTHLELDTPISLFQDALDVRPTGHPDRPTTQLNLAIALLSRFTKRGFQTDADLAEELLDEVLHVCHVKSFIYRSALAIKTSVLHQARNIDRNDFWVERLISSVLPLSVKELASRARLCSQCDDINALDEVISLHYDALKYYGTAHHDRSSLLSNLGTILRTRFERRGDDKDLDKAIASSAEALTLHPVGHPDRPSSLNNLAIALLTRFQQRNNDKDLDEAIVLHREALTLRPVSHPERDSSLNNLANALATSFKQRSNDKDLDEAIMFHREALTLHPVGHPHRPSSLINLASVLSTRFEKWGSDNDLDEAIALHREAQTLLPVGHPHWPSSSNNLARALSTRFKQRGDDKDFDEAIVLHREALALYPVGHPHRPSSLNNLANVLWTRLGQRHNDEDLDEAIALHREALTSHRVGHPNLDSSLSYLASALLTRFEQRGNDKDLEEAIVLHREALTLRPVGHPHRQSSLNNLASAVATRFKQRGNEKDLDEAITLHREALALLPVGHPHRQSSLNNLASAFATRFKQRNNEKDLDEVMALYREALTLRPVGHPHRPSSLNNLASVVWTRFKQRYNEKDLDELIALQSEALTLCPVGHPDRDSSLNKLASALSIRFKQRGDDKDLDEAIVLHREAQTFRPVGHPDQDSSLNKLASALSTRFKQRGDDKDLDESLALQREALTLCPIGHPDRGSSLNNLANTLTTRFKQRGNDNDLDEAVALQRESLTLRPVGHPHRSLSLNNLASALAIRFEQRGNDRDLDEAIALHREALTLRLVGNPSRDSLLNNLAISLSTRFKQRNNEKDLDEAMVLHREALTLRPVGHPYRPSSLNNLASVLCTRSEQRGNGKDLDEAIALQSEAQSLHHFDHPDRPSSLSNLASVFSTRFKQRGNETDLDEAIALYREAQTLRPVGHPDRPSSLHNFATELFQRFILRGTYEDLDNALANARSALTLLAGHDPLYSAVNRSLATMYLSLHQSYLKSDGNDTQNLNAAIYHLKTAVDSVSSGLLSRLKISLQWVRVADQYTHNTLLEAYATSMQLLDAYMSATASVPSRHHTMKAFPRTLAVDAASSALQHGDVCRAVELLEQGRTLIWTQMARFRTPLDSLLQEHGDHAQALAMKFRQLSSLLDKPPAEFTEGTPILKIEAEATRHTRLVDEWNNAVQEIRKLEGFSRFMLPPLFSDLQDAARDGPIIILIASKLSCDAIIIPHQHSPVNVRLATSRDKLVKLMITLQVTVRSEGGPGETSKLIEVLRELWTDVVCPVVESLARFAPLGSRIWWCPSSLFNFLPLHAVGEYRRGGRNLSQSYVSSYTPSLTALIKARRGRDRSLPPIPFAAIGQDHPPGYKYPLPSVEPELELVGSLLPAAPIVSFTKLTSAESTKSRALLTLQDNHWLHFACHGKQNFDEPFQSAFLMRDEPLALLDITQTDLSQHEFAFLSACETAVGDMRTPDEAIHLAAALQLAGVKSVIGTFWSVEDSTVRRLVEKFYKHFCGDGKMNSKRAAKALHKAVLSLTNDKEITLDQRIVFMHIGL